MLVLKLKEINFIRDLYFLFKDTTNFFKFSPISLVNKYTWFFKQFKTLRKMEENKQFQKTEWHPCLSDNLSYTPLEPTYFFQDSWAAGHIFKLSPKHHYDVGSSVKTMGIISQFTPTTIVDIRPIDLKLNNLFFKEGSILSLPFENNSIESLSSLCVIEHIGLGRYGDRLDPFGSEKAIKELERVLKPRGILLLSVPIDSSNTIYFNAHRAFTRSYILSLLTRLELVEEKYHYGRKVFDTYDQRKGFGTGFFLLKKL